MSRFAHEAKRRYNQSKDFATSTKGKTIIAIIILLMSFKYRNKIIRTYCVIKRQVVRIWNDAKTEATKQNNVLNVKTEKVTADV